VRERLKKQRVFRVLGGGGERERERESEREREKRKEHHFVQRLPDFALSDTSSTKMKTLEMRIVNLSQYRPG
jgi:hypothetical protein